MIELPVIDRDQTVIAETSQKRALGTALTQLVLTVSLIASILAVLAVTGASGVLAQARSDLIMMEEAASGPLTTFVILTIIAVVMGVLTILALRDVAPAHSKRTNRRTARR